MRFSVLPVLALASLPVARQGGRSFTSGHMFFGNWWECCALQWSAEKILIWVGSGAGLPGRPEMIISTLCMCQHVRPVATGGKPSSGSRRPMLGRSRPFLRRRAMAFVAPEFCTWMRFRVLSWSCCCGESLYSSP